MKLFNELKFSLLSTKDDEICFSSRSANDVLVEDIGSSYFQLDFEKEEFL